MKDGPFEPRADDDTARPGESFLQRFHRRKTEARSATPPPHAAVPASDAMETGSNAMAVAEQEAAPEPSDADMPPLESLSPESDYTGFLSPKVSEGLHRAALRKLFRGPEFNVIDELDDYAEDFTTFKALGDIVTSDMRHLIEVEARKRAEALKQALLDAEKDSEDLATREETLLHDTGPALTDDTADPQETAPPPRREP